MSEPFLGEIEYFGFNFAPRGWALCAGQSLPIAQNQALFSLLGTTYGGNGTTNFNLPDLRGRVAVGQGTGPGLTTRSIGQTGGEVAHVLDTAELRSHSHIVNVVAPAAGTLAIAPGGNYLTVGSGRIGWRVTPPRWACAAAWASRS